MRPNRATAPASAPVTFPTYGFSINPFDMPTDNGPVLGALSMSYPALPMPSNSKILAAPSVNVIVWPGNDDMIQYETQESLDLQMRGLSIQHDEKNPGNTEWKLEYVGVSNGVGMHWYAHVVKDSKKRIFIATGSAPDEMWGQFGGQIKACVDSLKATGTSQIAPLPWYPRSPRARRRRQRPRPPRPLRADPRQPSRRARSS